jgi:hypothetical protein
LINFLSLSVWTFDPTIAMSFCLVERLYIIQLFLMNIIFLIIWSFLNSIDILDSPNSRTPFNDAFIFCFIKHASDLSNISCHAWEQRLNIMNIFLSQENSILCVSSHHCRWLSSSSELIIYLFLFAISSYQVVLTSCDILRDIFWFLTNRYFWFFNYIDFSYSYHRRMKSHLVFESYVSINADIYSTLLVLQLYI